MDKYTILCTELRGSAQSLNGNIDTLQKKADKLQKAINKVTRGDYKASDLSSAYTAQNALSGSITRLGDICTAMNTAAMQFSEASAELCGRANLTAYYMQHMDTLTYDELMGTYSAAITSAGGAVAGYELLKSTLGKNGYSVGELAQISIVTPLVSLVALETIPGSSGGGSRGKNSEAALIANDDEEDHGKVKIKPGDEASDIGKSAQDAVIDDYRKNHGKEGKKEEYKRYIYSSTDSGTVSILGTDFRYDKYTDYIGGSFDAVDGDSFYSVDTEFGRECQHIDFEATDGSGLSGDITMNGIKIYGDGEFDLAKGNAYMKAGADYTVASITVDAESDFGGFSLTGEVGAGAHLDAGIHDGKFTVDVGAAFGIGAGVKLEINYKAIWKATCNAFGF